MKKANVEGLDSLIKAALVDDVFPGANYTLVTDKDEIYGSFGKKAVYPEIEDNDLDTIYDMASCSKVISTTTSIMMLLEQGKLRLYDSVKKYIPRFRYSEVTIWDLMTHSSGLPSDIIRASRLKSREEALDKVFDSLLIYEKNTKIVYSDIGFIILGLVVEAISGMGLDEFARINIFEPLEMTSTGYNPTDTIRCAPTEERKDDIYNGVLRGKVHDEKAYIMGGVAGHAGLFSCVKDLNHFIKMILNDGVYNGKQILSKATIDLLFTPQIAVKVGISLDDDKRGLGWIVRGTFCSAGDLASPQTILHTGFTGTNIFVDLINRVGFSMLTNRVHPTRDNVKIIPFRGMLGNYIIAHFGGNNSGN
ncbi:MAG TPA: serine hydrolase [Bacilli bacterium]|nr:serine hydrolase [Bacilli bacterium]